MAGRAQDGIDELGGRRLAARTGNADDGQGARRVGVVAAGEAGDRTPAVCDSYDRRVGHRWYFALDDQRGGATGNGYGNEVVPVGARFAALALISRQADEQIAWLDLARVRDD